MSFLGIGGSRSPAPAPLPQAPDNPAAEAERAAKADAAAAEARANGRRSTIVGGMQLAADDQYDKGALGAKKRGAARDIVG